MKRVLFYIHNGWVFGKIHNELIKLLLPEFYCDILCWSQTYTTHEITLLAQKYDLIVSTPATCFMLHHTYGIPYEKLVGIVHQDWDVFNPLEAGSRVPPAEFARLAGYAVICPLLVNISLSYGIERIPRVVPIGVYCDLYTRPMSQHVKRLGYFGRMARKDRGDVDIKRGQLAQTVAARTGMEFVRCDSVHFLAADRLYRDVDLVMFCSLIEGNPYMAFEAFAAGVPVLGTAVGRFPELAAGGAGAVLPFEAAQFVEDAVEVVQALQADHAIYSRMHAAALLKSQELDWSAVRPTWIEFLRECSAP
jgi:glycosyltransferase involved in cell wall biosynthesis